MSEQKLSAGVSHRRVWVFSAGIFLLLAVFAAGPLVFKAFADVSSAHQQAIQSKNASINQAIIDRDYDTWQSLVTDQELKSKINADNFGTFADAYILLEQGKLEEADILKKQLALKEDYQITSIKSALIGDAIANRDYTAWREVVGESYAAGTVTDGNFGTYARILDAAGSGKLNVSTRLQYSLALKQKLAYGSGHDEVQVPYVMSTLGTKIFQYNTGNYTLFVSFTNGGDKAMMNNAISKILPPCGLTCADKITTTAIGIKKIDIATGLGADYLNSAIAQEAYALAGQAGGKISSY